MIVTYIYIIFLMIFILYQMEVLNADMASLSVGKRNSDSILDVVGVDVNSSYDRAIQIQFISDTFNISTGGQDVGPNRNIQILLRDDNAIHYMKRSGLLFDFIANGHDYVHNAAALFSGLEVSIGGVTFATPFSHFYAQ